jgi:hypothetical protein
MLYEDKSYEYIYRKIMILVKLCFYENKIDEEQFHKKCSELLSKAEARHKTEIMFAFTVSKGTYWSKDEFYRDTYGNRSFKSKTNEGGQNA